MTSPDVGAVVFDVGGVFVLPNPEVLRPALVAAGLDACDDHGFHRAHYAGTAVLDAVRADPDAESSGWPEYLWAFVATVLGPRAGDDVVEVGVDALRSVWSRPAIELWSWVQAEAVDALASLVAADWPVAIVSNADGTVEESLRARGVCQVGEGDGSCVLHITDSRVVGVEKPDAAIFADVLAVMAEHGIAAERCLYVGDTWSADVVGARAAGMQVVQVDPYDLYSGYEHPRARSVAEVWDRLASV
jgi:putative hydrolase of the HAD superfamily